MGKECLQLTISDLHIVLTLR